MMDEGAFYCHSQMRGPLGLGSGRNNVSTAIEAIIRHSLGKKVTGLRRCLGRKQQINESEAGIP